MLRLENDIHDSEYVKQDKRVVEHSRASLVEHTVAKIVNDTHNRQNCDITDGNQCRYRHLGEIGYLAEFCQLREMFHCQCHVVGVDEIDRHKPIWTYQSQQRRDECAQIHRL